MRICASGEAKNMSALANCFSGLNVFIESGTKLKIRKKEKNDSKKAALNVCPMYMESHFYNSFESLNINHCFQRDTFNGAVKVKDLVKYLI